MDTPVMPGNTRAGTAGGTLLVVLLHLNCGELVKTAVLAAVGAAVSFAVSFVLQRLVRQLNKEPPDKR
jgi:mannitol-specific phosphotransferase system IIBC component